MKTVTKGIDLYRETLKVLQDGRLTALQGHKLLSEGGEKDLRDLLSGSLTPRQTRGAFARGANPALSTPKGRRRQLSARQRKNRGLSGAVPLNPINMQSRRLIEGVALRKMSTGAALQEMDLVLDGVDYAQFVLGIGGTRFMVARGVQAELKKRFGPRNKAFVDYYVRHAGRNP